jgi:hypothetical protein
MGSEAGSLELPYGPGTQVSWIVRIEISGQTEPSLLHVQSTLEIERAIATHLSKHANGVIRVVHTLTTREFHLHDGSTIVFKWEPQISDWRCVDCGVDTDAIDEYYMVDDPVWQQAASDTTGHLCISCLEHRLGRTLTAADFTERNINTSAHLQRSPRLTARIQAQRAHNPDMTSPT